MRKRTYALGLIVGIISITVFVVVFFVVIPQVNQSNFQNVDVDLKFDGDNTYDSIQDQLNIGYRIPGTNESRDCVQYFISQFLLIDTNFTYLYHNYTIHGVECQNILFKMNPEQPNILILGSHYDSRAKATKDDVHSDSPVPGANDGASSSAALIELARVLYNKRENLSCQIWFIFFDAEDQGYDLAYGIDGWAWCEGSEAFVDEIHNFYNSSKESFDAMVLLDMIGGNFVQYINEQYSTSSLLDEIFQVGQKLGYTYAFPESSISNSILDDHVAFINYGIPSADLIINFWNNPIWPYHHTIQDDITHISNQSLELTGKTIEQFIYNNYLNISSIKNKGNYPWSFDFNVSDFTTILLIGIIVIGVIGTGIYIYIKITKSKENLGNKFKR
ncbi:MAG: M28 family peptidase [Candidatus Lokiarchaeota archaeon]|nr:M28 family peptidase [Candidatus Lokiarchaeota archaeon]MBD3201405.1 M28 family peptidase [Candidatus Lokiarchaeota archaeon]